MCNGNAPDLHDVSLDYMTIAWVSGVGVGRDDEAMAVPDILVQHRQV